MSDCGIHRGWHVALDELHPPDCGVRLCTVRFFLGNTALAVIPPTLIVVVMLALGLA